MNVTSTDGTTIGYRQIGRGPGFVIIHGAMETGAAHTELAEALSGRFSCYLPDRRGRGTSGPPGPRYGIDREVEDIAALLDASGATAVLGVSSGAIVALHTALARPDVAKAVIFEPPLSADTSWLPVFDDRIARGDVTGALILAMKRLRMGPGLLNALPTMLLRPLTAAMANRQRATGPTPSFADLAPTLHEDVTLVAETAGRAPEYADLKADMFLLGAARSPAYLKAALDTLASVLPGAVRTELPGVDHRATGPAAFGGAPEAVAREVAAFLAG